MKINENDSNKPIKLPEVEGNKKKSSPTTDQSELVIRRKEPAIRAAKVSATTIAPKVALSETNIVPSIKDPPVLKRKQKRSILTHIKTSASKIRERQAPGNYSL